MDLKTGPSKLKQHDIRDKISLQSILPEFWRILPKQPTSIEVLNIKAKQQLMEFDRFREWQIEQQEKMKERKRDIRQILTQRQTRYLVVYATDMKERKPFMKEVLPNFPPFAPRVFNEDNVYIEEFIKLIKQYMHMINIRYQEVIKELSHLQK